MEKQNGDDRFWLTLQLVECDKPAVEAACKIIIISTEGRYEYSVKSKRFRLSEPEDVSYWGLMSGRVMSISCVITTIDDPIFIEEDLFPPQSKLQHVIRQECSSYMFDNLKNLLETQKFCDVTIITAGREIPAHKVILAAQSPVFLAMFSHEMKEQQENRVDITDFDEEIVIEMLRFIYTGKTANLDKMAEGLLPAAEKYQLLTLKELCTITLRESIATENAVDRLILGDIYDIVELKAAALDFICIHGKEVIKTTKYKLLSTTYPHLMDEAFRAIVMNTGYSASTFWQ